MKDSKVDFLQKEQEHQSVEYDKKKIAVSAAVILAVIFLFGGVFFAAIPDRSSKASSKIADKELTPANPTEGILRKVGNMVFASGNDKKKQTQQKRINFLLLGMGGPGHSGPYLTDTIIIASVKPATGEVAMVSIPRDLRVKIPDHGYSKINYVNAYGEAQKENWGAAFTAKLIENKFNIDINYYLRADFQAFREVVNEIGGIKVRVTKPFTDPRFPSKKDTYKTVRFSKGLHKMDGQTALNFARSRHGNNNQGSDFARARRQQKVILAAKEKLMSYKTLTNPKKIKNILTSIQEHITTNMTFSDITHMADLAQDLDISNMKTVVIKSGKDGLLRRTTGPNGNYLLVPKSGNFKKISAKIKRVFSNSTKNNINITKNNTNNNTNTSFQPTLNTEAPSSMKIEIQNGTWNSGLAARTQKNLSKQGFVINRIRNTKNKPIKTTAIYKIDRGEIKGKQIGALSNEIQAPIREQVRPGISVANTTDVLIILGRDFHKIK